MGDGIYQQKFFKRDLISFKYENVEMGSEEIFALSVW